MSARERPWMKFYPADWRSDPMLRNCTLTARGLWMEMLALMHESERYGYLLVNGKPPSDRQLAIQAGALFDEIPAALAELEAEGVFSRDRNGVIYSRRMIRDEKKADHARKVGKKGGNPRLAKQTENSAQDNPQDKRTVNGGDKAQRPESRVQSEVKAHTSEKRPREPALPDDLRAVMDEAGLAAPPDRRILQGWYDAGATLEQDILPTIRRVCERERQQGKRPSSLKYFDSAIREKLADDEREIERLRTIRRNLEHPEEAGFRV